MRAAGAAWPPRCDTCAPAPACGRGSPRRRRRGWCSCECLLAVAESDFAQRVDSDLGVDLGGARGTVPDEVADGLEVEVRIDEALHRRVPQGVRSRPGNIDTRFEQVEAG